MVYKKCLGCGESIPVAKRTCPTCDYHYAKPEGTKPDIKSEVTTAKSESPTSQPELDTSPTTSDCKMETSSSEIDPVAQGKGHV